MIQQYKYEEVFRNDISLRMKKEIKDSMELALEAYTQFVVENRDILSYPKKASVLGRWRTYMIERQIYNRAFRPDAEYSVRLQDTNNFGDKALFLETENFMANISRTLRPMKLPATSAYRLEAARNNEGSDMQFSFDLDRQRNDLLPLQYMIITYGFDKLSGKLSHIMYVVPDAKMKNILFNEDGMDVPSGVDSYTHDEREESIVRLKKELKKKIEE